VIRKEQWKMTSFRGNQTKKKKSRKIKNDNNGKQKKLKKKKNSRMAGKSNNVLHYNQMNLDKKKREEQYF
jgi:hypothetical protein